MEKFKLYVISHTHWDREWYEPFQQYRFRLVRAMDNLIRNLEEDENFPAFHLDGQTIVLEDYLEVRPEMKERLSRLIRDGRILIGPWYVMPDEFLVSGESLIKNLQMGHKICREFGTEPMKNGYVTDIFGHNSQLPQILNGFDIHSATLYRGIGDFPKDAFRWQSPDGSEVVAAKLEADRSYSNFYFAVRWPYEETGLDEADAVKRMKELIRRAREMSVGNAALMMDGVDHCGMEPEIPKMLALFRREIPDVEFIHTRIEDYFSQVDTASLSVIQGSLYHIGRRGGNNWLLKNVLSSMVHLKQANDRCETDLTAVCEPLNAFCEINREKLRDFKRDDYSLAPRDTYLDMAWKYLITNHPHDSICGCSMSLVHRDNEFRYRQAQQIGEVAARDCLGVLSRNIRCEQNHPEAILLYNPSQVPVDGVQIFSMLLSWQETPNRRFFDALGNSLDVQILEEQEECAHHERLLQLIRLEKAARITAAAELHIPAFGYTVIYCDQLDSYWSAEKKMYRFDPYYPPHRLQGGQMTGYNRMDNGNLIVALNERGLLNVTQKADGRVYRDLHLLEDRSDVGEGWNWRPAVQDGIIYGSGALEQFSVLSDGPLCTVWKLTYALRLPEKASACLNSRSEREHIQHLTTVLTLPRGSEILYFKTELKNETENHRLRVLFPTGLAEETGFYTKTPFDFVRWDIAAENDQDSQEPETRVHPSQGITRIGGDQEAVALYAKGLYEVEVTDDSQRALALTLFRAAQTETGTCQPEDIKMQRQLTFAYALSFARQTPTQTLREGERWRAGVRDFAFEPNPQANGLPDQGSFLELSQCQKVLSHISRRGDWTTLRLYDTSGIAEEVTVTVPGVTLSAAEYTDLLGNTLKQACFTENQITISCPAHGIVTIRFRTEMPS
ncbi:MAG: glycoside hydrolase family 38 C-terminal domain-containing protein [Faecousia sp.]